MSEQVTLGQRIRKLRIERRYTQEYLADRLGTTKQAIYKYEADIVRNIPQDKLTRLAIVLGCSVEWLLGESDAYGSAPAAPVIPVSVPSAEPDPFQLYQELTDTLCRLTPEQRRSVVQYAKFLLSQES